jgi:tyrosine-protein phosphatase SIW14
MPRWLAWANALFITALVIAGPLAYSAYQAARYRNLHVVRTGVLYRSGQLPLSGLDGVIRAERIKTVVTLRDNRKHPDEPYPDTDEEEFCKAHGIRHYRLPPIAWSRADGSVPAAESVNRFLAVMRDPSNYPVLIHCFAGKHRTGAFCALYRIELEHWDTEEAITEMVALGYDNVKEHQDLLAYLRHYQPSWRKAETGAPR